MCSQRSRAAAKQSSRKVCGVTPLKAAAVGGQYGPEINSFMPVTPALTRDASFSRVASMMVAIFLAAMLSRFLSPGQSLSLVWAPAGLIFAFAWKFGRWTLIPSCLALVAWGAVANPDVPWVGVAAALAETLCALSAVTILRFLLSKQTAAPDQASAHGMPNLHWLMRFYIAALAVGASLAGCVGAAGFMLSSLHPALGALELWVAYWIIQSLGLLFFAPLTLAWLGAGLHDANPVPFPSLSERRVKQGGGLDVVAVALVLTLTGIVLILRSTGHAEFVSPTLLAYIPAAAFCAMRRDALSTYATLTLSGLLLCTALSVDSGVLASDETLTATAKVPLRVFETITVVFVSTLFAQILQAVSRDRADAMQRLREQSSLDLVTGLGNEFGFEQWMHSSDPSRSWLVVGVSMLVRGRLGALVGPLQLMTMRQLIADRIRMFGGELAARADNGRYLLVFKDEPESLVRIAELSRSFESFSVRNAEGREVMLPAATQVLRIPPGTRPATVLLLSILASLQQQEPFATSKPVVHALTPELQDAVQQTARRKDQVRSWIVANRIELFGQIIEASRSEDQATQIDMEVLCRLLDDKGTLLQPVEFLDIANQSGMAAQLDRQIIKAVFGWFKRNPEAFEMTRKCSINLAAASLSDPGFLPFVRAALAEHSLQAERFCFEITESSAVNDVDRSRENVQHLRAAGFRVSLDDFGTGFATYSYLKRYEVDEIKIDGTFITALGSNSIDTEIVESIVRVARRLNVKTVAEFVATPELREHVKRLGVDYVQGYAIGMPRPIAKIYSALREAQPRQTSL